MSKIDVVLNIKTDVLTSRPAVLSRAERAARVLRAVQREVQRTSIRAVAKAAEVSKGAIENANRGAIPQGDTLDRLEVWARSLGYDLDADLGGVPLSDEQVLEACLVSFEQAVRNLGGSIPGISDLERRERIRAAIDAQIQSLSALGKVVPGRLYELRGLAEQGEI